MHSQFPRLWTAWKLRWRRLEMSPPVRRVKRFVRQYTGREPRARVTLRCRPVSAGGWCYAPDTLIPESVIYSFGVGQDLRFELALSDAVNATAHCFDPTPLAVEWVRSQQLPPTLRFHEIGIAGIDGTATFQSPLKEGRVSYSLIERRGVLPPVTAQVRSLGSIMTMLGHDHVDLLKLDVEGAEYDVIDEIVTRKLDVRQLLVEFHHRFKEIGPARTATALTSLRGAGFQIFYIAPGGHEMSFLRCD